MIALAKKSSFLLQWKHQLTLLTLITAWFISELIPFMSSYSQFEFSKEEKEGMLSSQISYFLDSTNLSLSGTNRYGSIVEDYESNFYKF